MELHVVGTFLPRYWRIGDNFKDTFECSDWHLIGKPKEAHTGLQLVRFFFLFHPCLKVPFRQSGVCELCRYVMDKCFVPRTLSNSFELYFSQPHMPRHSLLVFALGFRISIRACALGGSTQLEPEPMPLPLITPTPPALPLHPRLRPRVLATSKSSYCLFLSPLVVACLRILHHRPRCSTHRPSSTPPCV
jgi:hypothetical protein